MSKSASRERSEVLVKRCAVEVARKEQQGNACKITRLVCGKYSSSRNFPVRDKQGHDELNISSPQKTSRKEDSDTRS